MTLKEAIYTRYGEGGIVIWKRLNAANMTTFSQLDNAPLLGHFAGYDIYQVVAELRKLENEPFEQGEET